METSEADPDSAANHQGELNVELLPDKSTGRPAWGSKVQYILAQVGFSVGLGNVWRFPYLCHQNGGGAFLLLYFLLLVVIGIPLLFLELAAGQSIRQGSIGVWKHISPRLVGFGFASCVVCAFVSLYYNVIIAWSLYYLGNSFQLPLPWENCPEVANQTEEDMECIQSSPTTYFWYRNTLDVTGSIEESGGFNPTLVGCLFAAWAMVCLAIIKGIKSSGKLSMLSDVQVWVQAATQVFFALGLGFGTIIAYSSYNPRHNNCHIDGLLVSMVNFFTSVLATLVVFAVLGIRANAITQACVESNLDHLHRLQLSGFLLHEPPPARNVSTAQYSAWYQGLSNETEGQLLALGIGDCRVEDEMNKGVEGTGLAFITFTEAITLLPVAPLWSVVFFFMLLNLGLSSMLGDMQGIITPLLDNFQSLHQRQTLFTVFCCVVGFLFGLLFVQRSGSYFVAMFDGYSATLPLLIVVAGEAFAVAWIYGADKFLDDIEAMLGWRPWRIYSYMWRFVSLASMVCLLLASLVRLCLSRPTYQAWNKQEADKQQLEYPPWALGLLISLIVVAALPIPIMFVRQLLIERSAWQDGRSSLALGPVPPEEEDKEEEERESPADPDHQSNGYLLVQTEDRQDF
uniref:Uncharacterized protein n=1 Tax=Sphaerodactylus townsendi TaxID=933632 RepID=A0ACB8EVS6_9SAUR